MTKKKPNIIFILVDDLGWAELGCCGHPYNETPHIDALAKRGTRFYTAYASATVCSPSRAGLLTGQTPVRNGITDYLRPFTQWHLPLTEGGDCGGFADNELPTDTDYRLDAKNPALVTMPQMLQQQGYHTGIIGKWHLSGYDERGVKHGPAKYGFDEVMLSEQVGIASGSYYHPYTRVDETIEPVLGAEEYLVDRMNYEAAEFIKRQAGNASPFFLYLSHYAVHTTLVGRRDYAAYFMRKRAEMGLPGLNEEAPERTATNNPHLAAMLKSVDDGVGLIYQTLQEQGLAQDTIIVFTSDNGGEQKITDNGPLRAGKSFIYEGGLRVPLVIDFPGVTVPGALSQTPTINLDFYPTFAELSGYEIPATHATDGMSLLPLLRGGAAPAAWRERCFNWHYPLAKPHNLGGRSAAAGRQFANKYIYFFDNGEECLYDLAADEGEANNLAAAQPAKLGQHRRQLVNWLEEVGGKVIDGQHNPAAKLAAHQCTGLAGKKRQRAF